MNHNGVPPPAGWEVRLSSYVLLLGHRGLQRDSLWQGLLPVHLVKGNYNNYFNKRFQHKWIIQSKKKKRNLAFPSNASLHHMEEKKVGYV